MLNRCSEFKFAWCPMYSTFWRMLTPVATSLNPLVLYTTVPIVIQYSKVIYHFYFRRSNYMRTRSKTLSNDCSNEAGLKCLNERFRYVDRANLNNISESYMYFITWLLHMYVCVSEVWPWRLILFQTIAVERPTGQWMSRLMVKRTILTV